MRPVDCTTERFPLRPPGRGGNPVLALWLFLQLQGEAGPVCKVDVGGRMLPRSIAVIAAAVTVAICWASAWGQALPLLRFTTPRLKRDLPGTQGSTGLPGQTWGVPKEMQPWVRECALCWLQWGLQPGDWSASHRPPQCSQHAGSVPAQWDCRGKGAETGLMPQAPEGSKTVLEACLSVSQAAPSSSPWPCPVGLWFFFLSPTFSSPSQSRGATVAAFTCSSLQASPPH